MKKELTEAINKWVDCNKKIRFIETILHLRVIDLLKYKGIINDLIWDYQTYFGQLRVCGFKIEGVSDLFHLEMIKNTEKEIENLKIVRDKYDKAIKSMKV